MHFEAADSARNGAGRRPPRPHAHVVQFYEKNDFLYDAVSSFVAGSLHAGQPTIVIARPDCRRALAARLHDAEIDYHDACRSGRLTVRDARETLASFMRGSRIDEGRFVDNTGSLIQQTARPDTATCAFGEMVDVLFRDGNSAAAIRLEELWNELAHEQSFDLLCAYSIGNFYTETHAHQLKQICRRHTRVIPAESYAVLADEAARNRRVIELQQRERALQIEIEHRKAIEAALREALADRQSATAEAERASAAKSDFLAVISHELRTPLTAIIGYEELMQQGIGGPVSEQQRDFLNGIKAGAAHLLRIIDQILTQSRLTASRVTVRGSQVDMSALVSGCVSLMQPVATERGLSLVAEIPDHISAHTDAGKVEQILLNLLANAVKFTNQGSVHVRLARHADVIRCEVSDTGVGIDPAHLQRVFEPFEQVDASATRLQTGVGLGLSVSRSLARLLGGEVSAVSQPGMGSTFTLTVPASL